MQQRRWLLFAMPLAAVFAAGLVAYSFFGGAGKADTTNLVGKEDKKLDPLPIRHVVLFNSGVGYFQREGEVDGNARIDLTFPVGDINDLLKSLVLQDAKGKIGAVNYDSSDPIDKILRSFALDLTTNPTFGQILNQARGEKIEVTRAEKKDGATTKISGTIIGMESQTRQVGGSTLAGGMPTIVEVEILNLSTAAGMQAVPMEQVISVRFQNAALEAEFQRALQVLARSHDTQKKTVSVGFGGEGKRQVRVGYVVERPIWKTSYRLRLEPNGKVALQGWALIENVSDDDWKDVRMVLVSGKPISFKMNLYDPIYVPRPTVEPATFASLRPPVYGGSMTPGDPNVVPGVGGMNMGMGGMNMGMGGMNMGMGGMNMGMGGMNMGLSGGVGLNQFQQQAMQNLMRDAQEKALREQNKLTYEELQRRRAEALVKMEEAKDKGSAIAGFNFKEGVESVASSNEVGDYYQYSIDQKITLARQKSAMLPIIDQTIDGQKVSIFNEAVHARHPLLGLKLKNTSGKALTQGPITVYDNNLYGGDTRILDVQPGETRLLSYALDQGTEVKTQTRQAPSPDLFFAIGADTLNAKYSMRKTKTYTIKNRSTHDRQVIIEHPIKSEWKLADAKSPIEQTRDRYRFLVAVKAGQVVRYDVVEDMPRVDDRNGRTSLEIAAGINIKVESSSESHKLFALKIDKGFVYPTYKTRETKAYFVQNLSDIDRTFHVDHIVRTGWTRLDDKGDPQSGPDVFRFKIAAAKGKTGQHAVREQRIHTSISASLISNLSKDSIRHYLSSPVASADVKAALNKALTTQAKIDDNKKRIAAADKQLVLLSTDHARVRSNLNVVPMSSEHYKTYLDKFVALDKQIESLEKNVRELNATMHEQIRDYDQWLAKLDAE